MIYNNYHSRTSLDDSLVTITAFAHLLTCGLSLNYREAFKSEFGKAYATQEEEETRYNNFLTFLKAVDERNTAESGTATHGITKVCACVYVYSMRELTANEHVNESIRF